MHSSLSSIEVPFCFSVGRFEYLCKSIPDFQSVALRAHSDDKTLALAHEVEKVFGPGAYREVMLATEYSALKVIEDLEERKSAMEAGTLSPANKRASQLLGAAMITVAINTVTIII